jgi:hypothetical protein
MMKKFLQLVASADAQEIAELAIVLPILFALILAVFSFGRAYNIYATITRAAQDGARIAAAPLCSTCGTNSCTFNGTSVSTAFPCDNVITDAVNTALSASRLDPSKVTYVTPASTTGCPTGVSSTCTQPSLGSAGAISVCRNVALNTDPSTNTNSSFQACGTIVSFQYSFDFLDIPLLHINPIQIPASAQVRMEF